MSLRARRTALLTALLLAVPAGPALAQSPGDSQYTDPLAGESADSSGSSGSGSTGGSGSGGSSGSGSAGTTSGEGLSTTPPTPTTESTADASGTAGASASGAAATDEGRNRLPDTGADVWILAVLGGGLLLAGGALRLRTAR